MALDFTDEIHDFETAIYGKDVRDALVSMAEELQEQVNDVLDSQIATVDTTLSDGGATVAAQSKVVGDSLLQLEDAIISGGFQPAEISTTWEHGSINRETGANIAYKYAIRSDYVAKSDFIRIDAEVGYRATVYFYNGTTYLTGSLVDVFEKSAILKVPSTATRWRLSFYKITDKDGAVDVSGQEAEIATHITRIALKKNTSAIKTNGIAATYGHHPIIRRDGNDYICYVWGYARSVWAGGTSTGIVPHPTNTSFTISHSYVLVYTPETDTFEVVGTSVLNQYETCIPLLYNTYGALYGPWAVYLETSNGGNTDVPSYYNSELDTWINAVRAKGELLGRRSGRFVFITDYHITNNERNSPALIKSITQATGIRRVIFGGDAIQSYSTKALGYAGLCSFTQDFADVQELNKMYLITGNHEMNDPAAMYESQRLDASTVYRLFIDQSDDTIVTLGDSVNSFYCDDATAMIRYYFVGCDYRSVLPNDTLIAVGESLSDVSDGWAVLLISHLSTVRDPDNPTNPVGDLNEQFAKILPLFAEMDAPTSGGVTVAGQTFNYNDGVVRTFIGAIGGHVHKDNYNIYRDKYPVIATTCDARAVAYVEDRSSRDAGTVNEQAFDIVQFDISSQRIYLTRIGYGEDRVFAFGNNAGLITED